MKISEILNVSPGHSLVINGDPDGVAVVKSRGEISCTSWIARRFLRSAEPEEILKALLAEMDQKFVKTHHPALNGTAEDTYTQFGEDGLIAATLAEIGAKNQWCFEVGAADGRFFSNTLLLRERGWRAVLGESDDEKFAELSAEFGEKSHCHHGQVNDLDTLLDHYQTPTDIDLGVIDIDGADYWLWHDMERYRPRVLLIEFNPYLEQDHYDAEKPIGRGEPGQTSYQPLIELGEQKGYELWAETFCNLLFVDKRAI